MIYATEDGQPLYKDNGVQLWRVQFPEKVGDESAISVDLQIGKTELFPLEERCSIDGRKTEVHGIVNGREMTERTFCMTRAGIVGSWNKQFDIPWPSDAGNGTHDVELHFRQPNSGDIQFEDSWKGMPQSSITFTVERVAEGDEPPPGAGEECTVILGHDPCPDGYVCYEGLCIPESEVPDDPDTPDNGNGGDDPDTPDNGNGTDDGVGVSGQTLLVGVLGAGLWARSRRDD